MNAPKSKNTLIFPALILSLLGNCALGLFVLKQHSLIDRQMDLLRAVHAQPETRGVGGGFPTTQRSNEIDKPDAVGD